MQKMQEAVLTQKWWARQDLNLGPTDYESAALTAELRAPCHAIAISYIEKSYSTHVTRTQKHAEEAGVSLGASMIVQCAAQV